MLLTLPAAVPAFAQESGPEPLPVTAEGFLGRVEKANPQIAALEADVAAGNAAVTSAGLWANPSFTYDREEISAGDGDYSENLLRLELPLEISGRRGLDIEGAELGARAAEKTAVRSRHDILLRALAVYLRAASARLGLVVLRKEEASLGRLVEAVDSRATAGDASGDDLDRLVLEADALRDLIADAERNLMAHRRALGLLAGQPGTLLDASDALGLPTPPRGTAPDTVPTARSDYAAATLRVAQAEKELAAAQRGWVPALSLSGGAKSAVFESETRWGYVAGVALSLPFLDHGQADAERARARLLRARAEQRFLEQRVLVEVSTSTDGLSRTVGQARRFEQTQVPRLDRLVRRAEASYQEGVRPVFELLDAYRTARGTRLRAIELRLQARLAEVEMWRSRGLGPGGHP